MHILFVGGPKHGSVRFSSIGPEVGHLPNTDYSKIAYISIGSSQYHVFASSGCSSLEQWELDDRIMDAVSCMDKVKVSASTNAASDEQLDYGQATCRVKDAIFNEVQKETVPNATTIGLYADKVQGSRMRTPVTVAGRTLEECVELCLAAGLTTGEIYAHVTDSIYNQYVKLSKLRGSIKYPSEPTLFCAPYDERQAEITGEIGDVLCMLHDLAHVSNIDIEAAYSTKLASFINKVETGQFYATACGNLYVRKPHMSFFEQVKPDDEHDARI